MLQWHRLSQYRQFKYRCDVTVTFCVQKHHEKVVILFGESRKSRDSFEKNHEKDVILSKRITWKCVHVVQTQCKFYGNILMVHTH